MLVSLAREQFIWLTDYRTARGVTTETESTTVAVDLVPTAEQEELASTLGRLLGKEALTERYRSGGSADPGLWLRLAEMGVLGLGVPEEHGGADASAVEEAVAFRVLGAHLAPVELLGSALAAHVAAASGDADACHAITSGLETVAILLHGNDVVAHRDARWLLMPVEDGFALAPWTAPDDALDLDCIDPSALLLRVRSLPAPVMTAARLRPRAVLLAAAMLAGVADTARDLSVRHAKVREQFGRPIGVNQAVKHACADMAIRCEAATSLVSFAALAVAAARPDLAFQCAAAKQVATDAAYANSRATVQVHGGMGFTWEHDAHLLLTRTHLLDQLFGNTRAQQRDLLANAPLLP
jgi:alkylation response protein AidB-like acyl-CoA dehydrogenase